jgi:hypothetical protein
MDTLNKMSFRTIRYIVLDADTRTLEFFVLLLTLFWSMWLLFIGEHSGWHEILQVLARVGGIKVWTFWGFFHSLVGVFSQFIRYPKYRRITALCTCFYWSLLSYCVFAVDPKMLLAWFCPLVVGAEFFVIIRRFSMETSANK